eukprot:COSAG05_NODE_24491_length_251_cov_0.677632_1_plen_71_part_10
MFVGDRTMAQKAADDQMARQMVIDRVNMLARKGLNLAEEERKLHNRMQGVPQEGRAVADPELDAIIPGEAD